MCEWLTEEKKPRWMRKDQNLLRATKDRVVADHSRFEKTWHIKEEWYKWLKRRWWSVSNASGLWYAETGEGFKWNTNTNLL